MNEKEKVFQEINITGDTTLIFDYLTQGKYILKFINDRNHNGKWDTGNYMERIQPEQVGYYKGEISIRPNWELKIDWNAREGFKFFTVPDSFNPGNAPKKGTPMGFK